MSPEDESLIDQELRALRRKSKLSKWLSGEGPRTEEEKKLAATFFKPQLAKRAIALHRQSQASQSLYGEGPLSDAEKQLASQFTSDKASLLARFTIGLRRRSQLIRYLSGDKDAGIDKDK